MPAADWAAARAEMMLDPAVINLNTGSFGPQPRRVYEAADAFRRRLAAGPMDFLIREQGPHLWAARSSLADFVGGEPTRLVFTSNVSTSINIVSSSLVIPSPGEILLTDHEYGSMHWAWERTARRLGLTLRTFPLPTDAEDPQQIIDAAVRAMNRHTRVFFFSHVLSPTGLVLPAKELCAEARKRGITTVVDGAHAPVTVPLNLREIDCDFYGSNCHKWLLAPIGTGFLYLGPGSEDRVAPLQVSWGWHPVSHPPDARDELGSTARIRRLEFEATRDVSAWLAVPEAIRFQSELGFDRVRARQRELVTYARERIGSIRGLRIATPANPALSGPMVAFEVPAGVEANRLRADVWRERIEINVMERPDRLMVRTSTHFYNTEAEVDRLAEVLPGVLG